MKITVQSSKIVKPSYDRSRHGGVQFDAVDAVPLTVFDKANFDQYISGINFFHPPAQPNAAALEAGLAGALAEYREWAGRLGVDAAGNRVIWLNDAGARFVEATADVSLSSVMPMDPSPEMLRLHPDGDRSDGKLMLVQVTRFACGSVAVGHTMHHIVADGRATCNVLLAWGQATRGVPVDPVPVHDRASFFVPRCPPRVEFQHRGVEFKAREEKAQSGSNVVNDDVVVVHRARFSREFVSELKSRASAGAARQYSTLKCLAAHLWRCVTRARGLAGHDVTRLRVAVDGRARMTVDPRVPDGYTGNVVLWACPTATVRQLLDMPLQHAVELIRRAVSRVDDAYFRSFIDFASSGAVESERLGPAADVEETVLSPDLELDSLLHAPFYDMDFGDGPPFFFMPSYLSVEGAVFLVRSFAGDSSVDAYVPLLSRSVETFKNCCHSLQPMADARL